MGKVGKKIIGALLVVGGVVVGLATGNWTLGLGIASTGLGMIMTPNPKGLAERQGAILENRTGSQNGIPVIYGKTRVGGVLVDARVDPASTGRKRLAVVMSIAHGSQDGSGIGGEANLVLNPGGEIGTLGSQASSWTLDTGNNLVVANDFFKIGSQSLKIVNAGVTDSRSRQDFSVLIGKIYRVSGWIKTSALPAADAGFGAVLNIETVSGVTGFTILEKITTGADPSSAQPDCGIAADGAAHDWTFVSCLFKCTGANGTIRLHCQLGYGGGQSGTAWFDEVHLEPVYCEVWFDDRQAITQHGVVATPFSTAVAGESVNHLEFLHHLGAATQAVDARLNSLFATEWPSTSKGRGVAYTRFEQWYNTDVYPSGVPQIQFVIYGQQVYDPRDKTLKWSENPALCIRDYLTSPIYGLGIPAANIDEQSFIDMANYCDEVVTIPGLGSAARYTLNGAVDTNRSVLENINLLCTSCRGQVVNQGDRWRMFIRRSRSVSGIQISEKNTLEGSWAFTLPGGEIPNVVRTVYVDPMQQYQTDVVQWPAAGATNSYLTDDNGIESRLELDLPFTTHRARAEQLAMTILKEQRKSMTITVTLNETALLAQIGDLVEVTYPTPGWSAKIFDVQAMFLQPDSGVQAVLVEYDSTVYDLDSSSAPPTIPSTGLPNPFSVAAPTNFALDGSQSQFITLGDGTQIGRILAAWTPPSDPFFKKIEVEAKLQADSEYDAWGAVDAASDQQFFIAPAAGAWDVRIRSVNNIGVTSAWVTASVTVDDRNPQVLSITMDFAIAGTVIATLQADADAGSIKFVGKKSGFPTLTEVQATTAVDGRNVSSSVIDVATGVAMVLDDGEICYLSAVAYTQTGAGGFEGPLANGRASFPFKRRRFVLTSGSSFLVPADWNNARNTIEGIGGGAGGAAGTTNTRGGGGGGGGEYRKVVNVALTPGASIPYAIGGGGAAGTSSGQSGFNGGSTTFNTSTLIAGNGVGGNGNGNGGAGGTGGTGAGGNNNGGSGANGTSGANSSGGGGGGAGGSSAVGGNGSGTVGGSGGTPNMWSGQGSGNGGAGGTPPTPVAGSAGTAFGGGGGGGACTAAAFSAGAAGSGGVLVITWYS